MKVPFVSPLFISLLVAACVSETTPPPPSASENGRWVVVSATRNGRSTNTLDAAYFEFDTARHQMTTNFVGEELQLDYQREERRITTKGSALITQFIIGDLTDSTLAFSTEIRGTPFSFLLRPEVLRNSESPMQTEVVEPEN